MAYALSPIFWDKVCQGPSHRITQGLRVIRELSEGAHGLNGDKRITVMVQVCIIYAAIEGELLDRLQKESSRPGLALCGRIGIRIVEVSKD